MNSDNLNLLQGTLDILVLKALINEPRHGYAVARWIRDTTDDALQIEQAINEAIAQTEALAKGLCPVELTSDGLMAALQEHAANVEAVFGLTCTYSCEEPVLVHDSNVATHLYHIVQEAINNAVGWPTPSRRVWTASKAPRTTPTCTVSRPPTTTASRPFAAATSVRD